MNRDYILSEEFKELCIKIFKSRGLMRHLKRLGCSQEDFIDDTITNCWKNPSKVEIAASTFIWKHMSWLLAKEMKNIRPQKLQDSSYRVQVDSILQELDHISILNETEKRLIRYRFIDKMKFREISSLTGIDRSGILLRLKGAYRKLKGELKDDSG
jgi:DNA-directed RNA polymerase specialized sigma subunit